MDPLRFLHSSFCLLTSLLCAEDTRFLPPPLRPDPAPVAIGLSSALALGVAPSFEVLPGGELNAHEHGIEFHPKALLGLGWDGNPQTAPHADGDAYTRLLAGADLRFIIGDRSRFELGGELEARRYADTAGRDHVGGGLTAVWNTRDDAWWWRGEAGALREDQPLAATANAVSRDEFRLALAGGREVRVFGASALVTATAVHYREDAPGFIAENQDRRTLAAETRIYAFAWSRSALGLRLGGGLTRYANDLANNGGQQLIASVWWRHQPGDRTWITTEIGASAWRWSDTTAGDPANSDAHVTEPLANIHLEWRPEEHSYLIVGVGSELGDGAQANAARILSATLSARLRLADRLGAALIGRWERRLDTGAQPGFARELRRNTAVTAGIDYELRDGWALRSLVGWEDSEADIGVSYSRPTATMEIAAAF